MNNCITENKTKVLRFIFAFFFYFFTFSFSLSSIMNMEIFVESAYSSTETIQSLDILNISRVVRKPVFTVSDLVRHKPGCTATEDS